MSIYYVCSRCSLREEQSDKSKEYQVGFVFHSILGVHNKTELCKDCYRDFQSWTMDGRQYFTDMANSALEEERALKAVSVHNSGISSLDDHDCGTPQGQGCQVCSDRDNAA